MAKKTKSRGPTKPKLSALEKHAAAMDKHAKALADHSKIMAAATTALTHNTTALLTAKPTKTLDDKTTDAQLCMSQWLMKKKRVSLADSLDPNKNMATDLHVGGAPEMSLCLNWVQGCLSGKGDHYTPDPTSAAKLCTKALGEVVADIASKIS
jgi:hypothetical protein